MTTIITTAAASAVTTRSRSPPDPPVRLVLPVRPARRVRPARDCSVRRVRRWSDGCDRSDGCNRRRRVEPVRRAWDRPVRPVRPVLVARPVQPAGRARRERPAAVAVRGHDRRHGHDRQHWGRSGLTGGVGPTGPTGTTGATGATRCDRVEYAVYNTGGNLLPNQHMVTGTATLNGASPGLATVNLSGSAVFANSNYICTVGNMTAVGGTAFVTRVSPSQFTLTGDNGSNSSFYFACVGESAPPP